MMSAAYAEPQSLLWGVCEAVLLPLETEAPVMTPNGADFSFLFWGHLCDAVVLSA